MTTPSLLLKAALGLCILATSAATSTKSPEPEPVTPPTVALLDASAFHCPLYCLRCDIILDAWRT